MFGLDGRQCSSVIGVPARFALRVERNRVDRALYNLGTPVTIRLQWAIVIYLVALVVVGRIIRCPAVRTCWRFISSLRW